MLCGAEALGFPLPSGVLTGQLADVRREYQDKLSGLSRDIAIKQGLARGVILAPAIIIAIALVMYMLPGRARAGEHLNLEIPGTWFNDAGVFMGLDRTKGVSPQCVAGGYDDRSTSNMGVRLKVWEFPSCHVRVNAKYTHHSCALNPDRNGYD